MTAKDSPLLLLLLLLLLVFVFAFVFASACGGGSDDANAGVDASGPTDAGSDAVDLACPRTPKAADRDRFIVVSQPFDRDGMQSPEYTVVALSSAGELSETGASFNLSRAFGGNIAFTADGAVGVVAHDDGSIGAFSIADDGTVAVIEPGHKFEFYASAVRASADGRRIYVLDSEFRSVGGGIYSLAIACDGSLIDEGAIAPGQLPQDLAHVAGSEGVSDRVVVAAHDILDSSADFDLHIVDLAGEPRWVGGTDLFGAADAIVSEVAISSSGGFVFVGDACAFCGPNRIAVATMSGDSLVLSQMLPFNDPFDLVPSPFDDRMLALSGFGNAAFEIAPSAGGVEPFAAPVELSYVGGAPMLPGNAVMIERGALEGLVLFPEVEGIRRVQFRDGLAPLDLGLFETARTNPSAIGIQP